MRIAPPPPRPPLPFELPTFVSASLPSGLSLRAARWGKRPTVSVAILFPGAGSATDLDGKEGTAEITADSFLGGTRGKNARELAEALDDLAAGVDISAGFDSAVARFSSLERDLGAGLELLAEILTEPSFPAEEVEKSRRRHIDLLAEQRSEPDYLARERLLDRLYPNHPYGRLSATENGLAALNRDDVVAHYRSHYTLAGATIVLVGAADPERLLAAGLHAFGRVEARTNGHYLVPAPPVVQDFTIHLVNRPGSVQTNLLYARPATRRADERYVRAVVANQSLGGGASSRLFHVLREERALTYGAYSSLAPRRLAGHFGASIDCRTEATKEALSGLLGLIREFAEKGPLPEEHERSQAFLTGSFALARETPAAIAQDETSRILHGLPEDEWVTWRDRVRRVTREDARAISAELFDPSIGVLAAVGDTKKIRPVLEELGETTLWDADGPRR